MHSLKTLTLLLCTAMLTSTAFAQSEEDEGTPAPDSAQCCKGNHSMSVSMGSSKTAPPHHWYVSSALDGAIFGSAIFEKPGTNRRLLPTVRFSMLNIGYNLNYNFDNNFGFFTGLGIKNIGFIEKIADSTVKRRVYTIGIPIGFKLGNLAKRNYIFGGGGIDLPFNYREKGYVHRSDKQKFSEWFSDRTPDFMPYLFAGLSYGDGTTVKLQYYPTNFFNTEYNETNAGVVTYPYRGYSANLICLSVGFEINYNKKAKAQKKQVEPAHEDDDSDM